MNESQYQRKLIKRVEKLIPGCTVLKQNAEFFQGIPDLLILHNDRWAMLEVKISADAKEQPNQKHYIGMFDEMSFASFINPENEEAVLSDLQLALGSTR